jgi:predicted alpha/beta hydrolase
LQASLAKEAQHYEQVSCPIYALSFTDDELASERATGEWLKAYPAARLHHERLGPADLGVARVGHTGFIRPGLRAKLWPKILAQFQAWGG